MKALIILLFIPCSLFAQRQEDSNRGLLPQSVSITYNARNTALGFRYGYLFQNLRMPIGIYGSFSNTIHPDMKYNNYYWERKYSLGATYTLPQSRDCADILLSIGIIRNTHPAIHSNITLMPGQQDLYYVTNKWGCDIGVGMQVNHFCTYVLIDAINFFRYAQVSFGYTFSFYK